MYALENPAVGQIVVSRMGHDKGRTYLIAAVLSDFVLCIDGDARPIEKPKTKRIKHVKYAGVSQEAKAAIENGTLTDAAVRKICKAWSA